MSYWRHRRLHCAESRYLLKSDADSHLQERVAKKKSEKGGREKTTLEALFSL